MPGKVADFLRTAELEDAERAALDHGVTVRRGVVEGEGSCGIRGSVSVRHLQNRWSGVLA
ncbi:hypothetical protein [Streptomyces sp. NPDC006463]|uniref:hypothetical protein n=1 Tax=Streptomyces sp. NPDC006463 TaxID=3364746 RepID=UPI0036BD6257